VSNNLAAGDAQNAGEQANQNGQGGEGANNDTVVLSPEDQAAAAAAAEADAAAAAANGQGGGEGEGAAGGEGDAGGGRRSPGERIAEVVAERNAAMEYGNYWREQAFKLQQQGGGAAGAQQGADAGADQGQGSSTEQVIGIQDPKDPQPTLAQHNFDAAKWADANNAWMARAIERGVTAGVTQALSKRDEAASVQTTQQNWNTRVAEFRKTTPDFDMVTRNPHLPITESMAKVIMGSELGPAVFHHLGKNPPEAARIARMAPQQQREAIARLEGRLEGQRGQQQGGAGGGAARGADGKFVANGQGGGQQQQQNGNRSSAPPPPTGQRGGGNEVNLNTASLNDYLAARLPHIAGHRGTQTPGGRNAK
jgi:hypothetical protein